MKLIFKKRGAGKTTGLLYTSEATGYPILVADGAHKNFVKEQADRLGVKIPEPLTLFEVTDPGGSKPEKILTDDLNLVLKVVDVALTDEDESSDATE